MAKAVKKKASPEKGRGKYDEKLAVNGSFLDIIKAAVKDTQKTTAAKKKA